MAECQDDQVGSIDQAGAGCTTRLGWEEADLDKIIEIFAKQERSGWFKFLETELGQ